MDTNIERSISEIQPQNRILLNQTAFAQLQELIQTDPEPSKALIENMALYRQMIEQGTLRVED